MWLKGRRRLDYQAHYVVDGGKARIVLDALVTPSAVTENRGHAVLGDRAGATATCQRSQLGYVRGAVQPRFSPT